MFEGVPAWGLYVRQVKGMRMKDIRLRLKEDDFRPAFVFDRVSSLSLTDIDLPETKRGGPVVARQSGFHEADEWVNGGVLEIGN